jgi:hypothetical protein
MKIRWNTTLISTLLLSLCLVSFIPAGLRLASTWRERYLVKPGYWQQPNCYVLAHPEQNLLMLIGFCSLGFSTIGLIILWTGYKRNAPWAWFVMLTIFFCWSVPTTYLLFPVGMLSAPWSYWFKLLWSRDPLVGGFALGLLTAMLMLIGLVLPVRAFFRRSNG